MTDSEQTFLLLYEYVDNMGERRAPHREAHLAHIKASQEAGEIFVVGAYGDPVIGGALGFKVVSRDTVEKWVASDPYNLNGLVVSHAIHPWKLV